MSGCLGSCNSYCLGRLSSDITEQANIRKVGVLFSAAELCLVVRLGCLKAKAHKEDTA